MKLKFFLLTFLLLFARGCDFYSTSLWFFDNPTGEQNPLYKLFGMGWTGLVIVNIVIVSLIAYCFYYYSFKYSIDRVSKKPTKLTKYISERYFNDSERFYQVFYRAPKNKKTLLGHLGYVLIRIAIFGSLLATIHNLCQFYNVSAYNSFREMIGRPLYVIYGLILGSFLFLLFKIWNKEFHIAKKVFYSENLDSSITKNAT